MKIKVYINITHLGRTQISARDYEKVTPHGSMSCQDGILIDDPTYVDENCKKAVDAVIDFAEKKGVKYKIYNIADSWPAFCAWLDGVKVLPTIFIGKKKIEGIPTGANLEIYS